LKVLRKLQDLTQHEQTLYFRNPTEDKQGHAFLNKTNITCRDGK